MDQTAREVLLAQLQRQAVLSAASRAERLRRLPIRLLLPRLLKAIGGTCHVTAHTFFDRDMRVHLPDLVGAKLYQYGFFEEALSRAVIEHLRPDDVFIDIGAHVGYYTVLAALMVGPGGKVVAFEPTPRTHRELASNTRNLANVTLVPAAAWDSPARLTLRDFGRRQSSFNSVLAPRMSKATAYESIDVDAVAVDDWLDAHGVMPRFIKIDAESAEHRVIKGLARTIERYHPILSVEIGDYDLPDVPTSAELIRSLLTQGYDAWQYRDGRFEPHRLANAYSYDNLLFIPSGQSH